VLVTHTFSAPHLLPDHALTTPEARAKQELLRGAIRRAAGAAARRAAESLQDVTPRLGQSECRVSVNRDMETPEGFWIGRGDGPTDPIMTVLRLDGPSGEPAAILIHYAVQPSVLDGSMLPDGGKAISGDLAGRLSAGLETRYPGATALFLLGAAGDQAPIQKAKTAFVRGGRLIEEDLGEAGLEILAGLSERMVQDAVRAMDGAEPLDDPEIRAARADFTVPGKVMNPNLRELRPTRVPPYRPDGEKRAEVEVIAIGSLALAGVRPELGCVTARQIAGRSPYPGTLVLTMVNGGAKYMADADSYDKITYGAMNSPFAKGAAEKLADEAARLLKRVHGSQTS
jgi:hypothetical protein